METGTKNSVSKPCVLFCPCVVQKATAHFDTKALNMCRQSQKGFCGILVGIPQHQKGYLIYVHRTQTIVSSHAVVFDEIFYSALAYKPPQYSEALAVQPSVSYIPHTMTL